MSEHEDQAFQNPPCSMCGEEAYDQNDDGMWTCLLCNFEISELVSSFLEGFKETNEA